MNKQEHLLSILAEECAEVAQRASKAKRFGLTEIEPEQSLNNEERLCKEFADLCAVYEMLNLPCPSREDIESKKNKVLQFLEYSRSCGCLTEEKPAKSREEWLLRCSARAMNITGCKREACIATAEEIIAKFPDEIPNISPEEAAHEELKDW